MRNRFLFWMGLLAVLALILMGCSIGGGGSARVTPTPTKTMRPVFTSTLTATPSAVPTETPVPPSDTPVPPTEVPSTETPVPPTDTPTSETPPTEAPPTETPTSEAPPTEAAPTNTPKPKPTNTPAPPTNTPKPQVDFRVVEQRLMSKQENEAQRHMILIRVVDAANNPLHGLVVWDPNHPDQQPVSGEKPEPYHAEYTFWDYDAYQLEVQGASSEKTKVLTTDVHRISKEDLVGAGYCTDVNNCNQAELVQHFSWYVTFQRTH